MTATNHALAGAVVALVVKEPVLALPLAFLSHFLVDYIPHFSFPDKQLFKRNFNTLLIGDALMCVALVVISYFVFPDVWLLVSACMFLATSPDLMWAYYRLYLEHIKGRKPNYDVVARFHQRLQHSSHARFARRGIRNEVIWAFSMCVIIGTYI